MSETPKTLVFLAVGVVALLVAWIARPAASVRRVVDDSGARFFEPFDPLAVARLEITEFDEASASRRTFEVAKTDGVWSIPSHDGYPADAEDAMGRAAVAVVDLVKGPAVGDRPGDHALLGVLDPKAAELGAAGYGVRVRMESEGGAVLADLIVGTADERRPDQRFVRVPGRDRVYLSRIDTAALSTAFEDWIERDLLQLDPQEVARVVINRYSIDEMNNRILQGDLLELGHDREAGAWTLADLAEGEAIEPGPLDGLRTALGDLEIVDVRRKPAGLSRELQGTDALELDPVAVSSLRQRGYYISGGQLLSNEGEILVSTRDGVQYQLRFGQIATGDRAVEGFEGGDGTPAGEGEAADAEPAGAEGANRYLFVTASFDASVIPEPDYEPLPEERTAEDDAAAGDDETPADDAEAVAAERERILDENQRLVEEYEASLQAGRDRVAELNARFADWYYVISDEVYGKIRLDREEIVKPAEPVEAAAPAGPVEPAEAAGPPTGE
jgi:hypothetical protein